MPVPDVQRLGADGHQHPRHICCRPSRQGLELSPSEQGLLGSAPFWSTIVLAIPIGLGRLSPVPQVAYGSHTGGMCPVPVPPVLGSRSSSLYFWLGRLLFGIFTIAQQPAQGDTHSPVVPASRGRDGERPVQRVLWCSWWEEDWPCRRSFSSCSATTGGEPSEYSPTTTWGSRSLWVLMGRDRVTEEFSVGQSLNLSFLSCGARWGTHRDLWICARRASAGPPWLSRHSWPSTRR